MVRPGPGWAGLGCCNTLMLFFWCLPSRRGGGGGGGVVVVVEVAQPVASRRHTGGMEEAPCRVQHLARS